MEYKLWLCLTYFLSCERKEGWWYCTLPQRRPANAGAIKSNWF